MPMCFWPCPSSSGFTNDLNLVYSNGHVQSYLIFQQHLTRFSMPFLKCFFFWLPGCRTLHFSSSSLANPSLPTFQEYALLLDHYIKEFLNAQLTGSLLIYSQLFPWAILILSKPLTSIHIQMTNVTSPDFTDFWTCSGLPFYILT